MALLEAAVQGPQTRGSLAVPGRLAGPVAVEALQRLEQMGLPVGLAVMVFLPVSPGPASPGAVVVVVEVTWQPRQVEERAVGEVLEATQAPGQRAL